MNALRRAPMRSASPPRRRWFWPLCALLCAWAPIPEAWALRIIPPGSERAVLDLVRPFEDEGEVTPGVRLMSIRIESDRVRMTLRDGDGASGELELVPAATPGARAFTVAEVEGAAPTVKAALRKLADAVAHNDDGSFPFGEDVAQPDGGDTMLPPLWVERVLAGLGWLWVWLAGLLWVWRAARAPPRPTGRIFGLGVVIVVAVAAWVRLRNGFDPMHANDHAWEDAAVALGLASDAAAASRLETIYGPAFRMMQAPLAALAGGHFEALAWTGAAVGALATGMAALAAGALGGPVAGLLAGGVLALAPAAARVAASESDVVYGQFLFAWILALAARPRAIATGPAAAAAAALLALGHVVGPGWAAGAAGLAVALRHAARLQAPGLPVEGHLLVGPTRLGLPTREAIGLAIWVGVPGALAGALRLHDAMPMVSGRASTDGVAIATEPTMLLATDPAFFPPLVAIVAFVALVADFGPRRTQAGEGVRGAVVALLGSGALWIGTAATVAASLLVVACVTDALRYQAVLAVAIVVLAARLPAVVQWLARPRPEVGVALLLVVALAVGVEALRPRSGAEFVDTQIAAWRGLRDAAPRDAEVLTFVVPRGGAGRDALPDAPRGRWGPNGPTSQVLSSFNARARCDGKVGLPPASYLYLPPGCHAATGGEPPCAPAMAFDAGERAVAAGRVDVVQQWDRQRPSGEFLRFATGTVDWQLRRAGCPRGGERPGDQKR
ncbi:MAG: hypothetical protein RIT45_4032 [Pseudomonadota bacterium]